MALKSIIDRLRGWRDAFRAQIIRLVLDRPPHGVPNPTSQVVFVRWDGKLGDSVVLSWLYRELSKGRPDLDLTVLTHRDLVPLHKEGFGVENVVECSKRPGFLELRRLARQVRGARTIINLSRELKPRDFIFLWLAKPAQTVGLDDVREAISVKLGRYAQRRHFSEALLPWVESLGIQKPDRSYNVPLQPALLKAVKATLPEGPVVGFCPAGAGRSRQLSPEVMLSLLRIMRKDKSVRVALLVPASAGEATRKLLAQLEDDGVFVPVTTGGPEVLFSHVKQCDAIVSVDTTVVHIASGLKKHQIALYNPPLADKTKDESRLWSPNSRRATVLFAKASEPQTLDAIDVDEFSEAWSKLQKRLTG